ncbi:MAG: HIT domain-containing protein [Nitrospirales bacterium]|nr:HIT domain-containing protein [Nitrospirales bacterium]
MSTCLFCQIAEGQLNAKKVFEDDRCLAFDDVNPQAPVHTLVIPKRHVSSLNEFQANDTELLGHLLQTCRQVAKEKGVADSGYRTVINTGHEAGQTVFHVHVHVLGGRTCQWPPG